MAEPAAMTKGERESLLRVMRQRERVAKTNAAARSAQLMAEFEAQLDRRYSFDEDEVWQRATNAAMEVVSKAQSMVRQRCEELGIPPQFAPGLTVSWYSAGRNMAAAERNEMRRLAKRRVEQIEASACAEIVAVSVKAQEALLFNGITTDAAKAWIESLPSVETLMPSLEIEDVQAALSAPKGIASRVGTGMIEGDGL